jgi:hypothetical protein
LGLLLLLLSPLLLSFGSVFVVGGGGGGGGRRGRGGGTAAVAGPTFFGLLFPGVLGHLKFTVDGREFGQFCFARGIQLIFSIENPQP